MEILFFYLLKSSLFLALSMTLFLPLMLKETFHRLNRFMLLSIAVLSLLLPVTNIGIDTPLSRFGVAVEQLLGIYEGSMEFVHAELFVDVPVVKENPIVPTDIVSEASLFDTMTMVDYFAIIYFIVALFLLFRLVYMHIRVIAILQDCRRADSALCQAGKTRLLVHNGNVMPFSWFRWIVCSESDLSESGREIIAHEMAHVRKLHSWDILFFDLMIIFQWFNPLVWIMKIVIKDIHEYEADEAVIAGGADAKKYQLLIIKKAVGARLYSIANSFNHSLTKKRITMMCKKKSDSWRCAKALYIVPVAALAACSFSSGEKVLNGNSDGKVNEIVVNAHKADVKKSNENDFSMIMLDECDVQPKPLYDFPKWLYSELKDVDNKILSSGFNYKIVMRCIVKADGTVVQAAQPTLIDIHLSDSSNDNSSAVYTQRASECKELLSHAIKILYGRIPKWQPGEKDGKTLDLRGDIVFTNKNTPIQFAPEEQVYMVVEQQPEYPGGMDELMKYLRSNIKYPAESFEKGSQGRSYIQFIVEKDGSVSNVEVIKSSGDSSLDAEAMRVVSSMSKWKPGKQRGEDVRVKMTLPVAFILQGAASQPEKEREVLSVIEVNKTNGDANGTEYIGGMTVSYSRPSAGSVKAISSEGLKVAKAEFPGGGNGITEFINRNIRYPGEARKAGIQGDVIVYFKVDEKGNVHNINALKVNAYSKKTDVDYSAYSRLLSDEAQRIISMMPKWVVNNPDNLPVVPITCSIPIKFRLK